MSEDLIIKAADELLEHSSTYGEAIKMIEEIRKDIVYEITLRALESKIR